MHRGALASYDIEQCPPSTRDVLSPDTGNCPERYRGVEARKTHSQDKNLVEKAITDQSRPRKQWTRFRKVGPVPCYHAETPRIAHKSTSALV
ncbi:hypothetical protein AVEN_218782-1 [Araneus ventricosus]|uniref:Uncharacterized protein n=1 Tax=Araneus ventricosus TaxID=182803 RepID=A0A4Y2B4G1_ARAVE|nr:hypothetical protein AVEN_218782-1 [Araneus ventricosus]